MEYDVDDRSRFSRLLALTPMRGRPIIFASALAMICCLGCSGSGAQGVIDQNVVYSRWQAVFFGALVLLSALLWRLGKRISAYPMAFLSLLALHPAWWQGVASGDCGFGKADNSFHLSVFGVGLLPVQALHLLPRKPRCIMAATLGIAIIVPVVAIGVRPDPVLPAAQADLLNAAAIGDLPNVKLLVGQGVYVDARRRSNPPTRWEPLENAWTKLRWPHYPFRHGYTPLMLACIGDHMSTVEFLLDHGADVNATESDEGDSPFQFAVEYEHQDLIPLLLRHGAVPVGSPETPR